MGNDSRSFKDAIYHQFGRIGKAISSPKRLELLYLLSQGPKSVESLARETTMSIANVSQHLQTLLEARLVRFSKQGTYAIYALADQHVVEFLLSIQKLSEARLAEISTIRDEFFDKYDQLEPLTVHELIDRLKDKNISLIDVRPGEEYLADHIPGAISIPIQDIDKHLRELPQDSETIVYCRGPYCVYAAQAVDILRLHGIEAVRLEGGIHEWRHYMENVV